MTRLTLTILLLTTYATLAKGQNLVPNPSFEIYTSCPGSNWPNDINFATPWYNPNTCSPDYFDTCTTAISGGVGVPNNFNGYQLAHTGDAYAGLYVFGINHSNYRDYIQVPLLDSLKSNHQYCVTFYVNLPVNSNYHYAITEIGLLFSNNPIIHSNPLYFNYTPQISSQTGLFLTDTVNWMQITGIYTATGGEKYITIGNFKTDANTDTLNCSVINFSAQAYYNVDDVSIIECTTGISETTLSKTITVYPNPTSDQFYIETNATDKLNVDMYDVNGRHLFSKSVSDKENINVATLDNGIYTLTIKTADRVINKKLVIVH